MPNFAMIYTAAVPNTMLFNATTSHKENTKGYDAKQTLIN